RLRKDGLKTPVSLTMSPVLDEAGTTIGISVIARDLRKAHLIEAELLRREAVLRSILDTVPDALVIIGETGAVQSFSTAAARLFGRTQEEVIGVHVRMLIPAYDEYVAQYLRTGERRISGIGRNVVALRNDGSTFPIELSLGEVALPGLRLFTGFIRDLTEHQDRERRMHELRAELVHIARLNELGQMVSALAHEVAQPLASLVNYLSGIRRLLASGRWETAEQAIQRATEQAHRAMKIVQRLREFVRKGQTHKQVEDLRETIREAGALALLGVAQDFELQLDVSPDAERAVIDRIQIQQVLLNLVRNATEAMSPRAHGKLSIVVRRADNMAEISVTDDGPGLSESVR